MLYNILAQMRTNYKGAIVFSSLSLLVGLAGGLINGFFGTGGGILPALLLGRSLRGTRRFATVLAVTLSVTLLSAVLYLSRGSFRISDALPFLLPGVVGGWCGALLSEHLSPNGLRRIFGAVSLVAGILVLVR